MVNRIKELYKDFGNIVKNFSYNLSYQILSLILPIITIPYITRVFSQETIGLNAVAQANCSYFVLLGMLGITLLGPREIAKCQYDRMQLSERFSEIYHIQFLGHLVAIFLYFFYATFFSDDKIIYIYILYLLSSMYDISWFYIGIEDFKSVSVRNAFIKLLSFLLLFVCVRDENDIYIYICTLYIPQIIINIYMWCLIYRKHIVRVKTYFNKRYLLEATSLFIPQISSSIYTMLDKTVLGIFSTYSIVAIYTQAQTLLRLFMAIIPSFSRVMMPRISSSLKGESKQETFKYIKMSAEVVCSITFLLFFGVNAVARIFVEWYLPAGYGQTADIIKICSFIIIPVSGANLVAIQYLIPIGQQNKYTFSVVISTLLNIVLNLVLVPFLGIYGVCIGSIVAEVAGFLLQLFFTRKLLDLKKIFENIPIYIVSGLLMYLTMKSYISSLESTFANICISVIWCGFVYIVCAFFLFKIKDIFLQRKNT